MELCPTITADGRLPDDTWQAIKRTCRDLAGERVLIQIKRYRKPRSLKQLAYYWAVIVPAVTQAIREAGNDFDDDETHEFLKNEVGKLQRVIVLPGEVVKRVSGSTKRLTAAEMEIYLENVRAWAASMLGIQIPLPNEGMLYPAY